jgi:hypothetical protein
MIWAALAAAIAIAVAAAAAGPDYWKELVHRFEKAIKANVKDKERRETALVILKAADTDMLAARKQLVQHFNQAYAVHLRYESTRDDYLAAIDQVMKDVNAVEMHGLERRFELKDALTPAEYQAVFAALHDDIMKDDAKDKKKDAKQDKKDARKEARKPHEAD